MPLESGITNEKIDKLKSLIRKARTVLIENGINEVVACYRRDYSISGDCIQDVLYCPAGINEKCRKQVYSSLGKYFFADLENSLEQLAMDIDFDIHGGGGTISIEIESGNISHEWYEISLERSYKPAEIF